MIPQKLLAKILALPLAVTFIVTGGGVVLASPVHRNTLVSGNQIGGVSTDHIVTPDGIATVIEDVENGIITVIDEAGRKAIFDRTEMLDLASKMSVDQSGISMKRAAAVSEGTRAYLCNFFAGVAAGAEGWAWQTALALAKVHPGVRVLVTGGQIAFWAFITTHC